ncbi:zinc-dependent dehydrogenase [Leucobacter allii]|uniref:zinc-dependent dehydrogenase n=1 Tax=Leucobacter allii TaxID=2932247 RepID=UPI001FD07C9B|nr:zinc-dependent dehydrogenase [Leucobacter allii]UOR02496.1 zinc-dependent dehydrogenase [Leucobacter allii]
MKAAVFSGPGRLAVEERPIPELGAGDLLLRVRAASICGTDLRILRHGHFKLPEGTPRVLGHEVAGEVAAVGDRVTGFGVGDRLAVAPNIGCGACALCARGRNQLCPDYEAFGVTLDGGFQEYMLVPARALARGNVFRVPSTMPLDVAPLMEPAACCLHGQRAVGIGPGDDVVIIGAGPIGCLHALLAKRAGAARVIIANRRQSRLDIAGRLGADVLINATDADVHDEVMGLTDGRGADVVLTCVSSPEVIAGATDLLARAGRLNVFSGLGDAARPQIDVNALHYREIVMTGTTGARNQDFADGLELLADDSALLAELVSRRFGLEDIAAAVAHATSGSGMKPMITSPGASDPA